MSKRHGMNAPRLTAVLAFLGHARATDASSSRPGCAAVRHAVII